MAAVTPLETAIAEIRERFPVWTVSGPFVEHAYGADHVVTAEIRKDSAVVRPSEISAHEAWLQVEFRGNVFAGQFLSMAALAPKLLAVVADLDAGLVRRTILGNLRIGTGGGTRRLRRT